MLKKGYRINLTGPVVGAALVDVGFGANEALALKDGRVLAASAVGTDAVRLFAVDGTLVRTIDVEAGGLASIWLSVAPGEQRIMFALHGKNSAGWAWIDSGQKISQGTLGQANTVGQIANTSHEGTLLCVPDTDKVRQWPGGDVIIDPGLAVPASFGNQHAEVRIRGGAITGG